jgi:hypothetical protein
MVAREFNLVYWEGQGACLLFGIVFPCSVVRLRRGIEAAALFIARHSIGRHVVAEKTI